MKEIRKYEQFKSLFGFIRQFNNYEGTYITYIRTLTKEGNKEFLKMLDRFGFNWLSGNSPTEFTPSGKDVTKDVYYILNWEDKILTYADIDKVAEFDESLTIDKSRVIYFEKIMNMGFDCNIFKLNNIKTTCSSGDVFDAEKAVALAMLYNLGVSYSDVKNVLSLIPEEQYKNLEGKVFEKLKCKENYFFHHQNTHSVLYLQHILDLRFNLEDLVKDCEVREGGWFKFSLDNRGNACLDLVSDVNITSLKNLEFKPCGILYTKEEFE